MKKIKFEGKLSLRKETIAELNQDQMKQIEGGVQPGNPVQTKPVGPKMSLQICTYVRDTCAGPVTDFGGMCSYNNG